MWGCIFKEMKKKDPELRSFVENHPAVHLAPLLPRDAFYGGRVNASKLYRKPDISKGEKILFYDVISLYPTCNKV